MRRNLPQAGRPRQKAGVSAPFIWHHGSQENVCDLCPSVTRSGNRGSWFQEHWEQGRSPTTSYTKLLAFFLPSFTILPLSAGMPAHLVCRACHQAFRLEEQAFPCRMSAAHVSVRLKGRWHCLINHLNMPSLINACCVLHNIWDSTGETLGVGREQKVNIFWVLWNDKDRDGVTILSKKESETPSPPPLRGKATAGAWMHSNQRVSFHLALSGFDSIKNSVVSVWQAERIEGWWKRRRYCVAFRWTGWLIPLGLKGERSGTAETSMVKSTSRNCYHSNRDQAKKV